MHHGQPIRWADLDLPSWYPEVNSIFSYSKQMWEGWMQNQADLYYSLFWRCGNNNLVSFSLVTVACRAAAGLNNMHYVLPAPKPQAWVIGRGETTTDRSEEPNILREKHSEKQTETVVVYLKQTCLRMLVSVWWRMDYRVHGRWASALWLLAPLRTWPEHRHSGPHYIYILNNYNN